MDKKGSINEHSREKLLVYKQYLINYLSILVNQRFYKKVFIWDIFAGKGKDDNGNKGSALIAAGIIKDFRNKKEKEIKLFLNEHKKENYDKLQKNLNDYQDFITFFNLEGNNLLKTINFTFQNSHSPTHHLIFIDPFGYTQYSTETLKKLLELDKSEYILFIPTNHIYRFTKALNENNPAAKFLENLGVEKKDFKNSQDFVLALENQLKKNGKTDFVYSYKIENKKATNSYHHLFFITKHIKGAEKFLEAKNKTIEELKNQLTLFDIDYSEKKKKIKNYLNDWKSNTETYEWGIKNGFLPKEINPILKQLEKEYKLEFQGERKKGCFYLRDKPKKQIKIRLKCQK